MATTPAEYVRMKLWKVWEYCGTASRDGDFVA